MPEIKKTIVERMTPPRLIVSSFLSIILIGTGLLLLPWASKEAPLTFIEALFTSVSAVCVTGLTVIDVGSKLTFFGQITVMVLIQLGGLGVMTFSTFFLYMLGRHVSLRHRDAIDSSLSYSSAPNIKKLLARIVMIVLTIEAAGIFFLTLLWAQEMPFLKAFYLGCFHSVSAFCNAGFSLFPDSLTAWQSDLKINAVFMGLIISGGMGFVVLLDFKNLVRKKHQHINRFSFQSKMVLSVTALLIVTGALMFFLFEHSYSLKEMTQGQAVLSSFFQSVTARTAGFNTVDTGKLSDAGSLMIMALMFIGAAPGSCGGGVKVTTFGILFFLLLSRLQGKDSLHLFRRTVSRPTIEKAFAIVLGAAFVVFLFFLALLFTETRFSPDVTYVNFETIFFETISAFGTVGLSMGITQELSTAGRILIIILMFIGRLGPLTLAISLSVKKTKTLYRYSAGEIMIG